jgi:hypothetical protein
MKFEVGYTVNRTISLEYKSEIVEAESFEDAVEKIKAAGLRTEPPYPYVSDFVDITDPEKNEEFWGGDLF